VHWREHHDSCDKSHYPRRMATRKSTSSLPEGYSRWLDDLMARIRNARLQATLAVNSELIGLYWQIGHAILSRQMEYGWGAKIVDQLAKDLRAAFPDSRGFSSANLR
jgi:hypothetical protein